MTPNEYVLVNGKASSFTNMLCGVPQGTVLGPGLGSSTLHQAQVQVFSFFILQVQVQ